MEPDRLYSPVGQLMCRARPLTFPAQLRSAVTVRGFAIGQDVYGMNVWFAEGRIANKPRRLSHEARYPSAPLTARQELFERDRLQPAESVLIHGGTGAVGMFAVQLAHIRGAQVTDTDSASNMAAVQSLGANDALYYRGTPFEDCAGKIDLVFNTVGGDTLRRSWQVLKPGGRLVRGGKLQMVVDTVLPVSVATEACSGAVARRGQRSW